MRNWLGSVKSSGTVNPASTIPSAPVRSEKRGRGAVQIRADAYIDLNVGAGATVVYFLDQEGDGHLRAGLQKIRVAEQGDHVAL